MNSDIIRLRLRNFYRRIMSSYFRKSPYVLKNKDPIISFTFDDFPRSSYLIGGAILDKFNFKATYYVSFGLIGKDLPVGKPFVIDDIKQIIKNDHEIGCHTFDHYDAWTTNKEKFRKSIIANQEAFAKLSASAKFNTFSFPKTNPHPRIKALANRYYKGCRGGGQTYNEKKVDLNLLKSYFIDKKNREKWLDIKNIIDRTHERKAWLIISTHDICEKPSDFGCTINLFSRLVEYVAQKEIDVLKISDVLNNY